MDLADALGSNAPPARRWEILKDSKIGAFAMIALVFLLAWKGTLIWALSDAGASLWWLVAISGLGRLGAVALLVEMTSARPEGLAHAWQQSLNRRDLWLAAVVPLVWLVWADIALVAWLMLALALFLALYGLAMRRLFGGINGDMLGAAIEGGELWLLLVTLSWWQFVTG
jgi:adenosylcobinamide-GDP ribazoletransferase